MTWYDDNMVQFTAVRKPICNFSIALEFLEVLYRRMTTQFEVPDGKSICPDRPRRKVLMSRPSQTESAFVQTFKIAYVQTIVRSFFPDLVILNAQCHLVL